MFCAFFILAAVPARCAVEVHLSGSGGGTKTYNHPDGWWQTITYQSDVSLILRPETPVLSGQFLHSSHADIQGSIRFRGRAEDHYFGEITVWDFDVTRNYDVSTDLYFDFLQDGRVDYIGTPLPYGADSSQPRIYGLKFLGGLSTITNFILLPNFWFFSDRFPSPCTATVSGAEGRMGGTVRDICSGAPVDDAVVQIVYGSESQALRTGPDGRFQSSPIPPGVMTAIQMSKAGYEDWLDEPKRMPAFTVLDLDFDLTPVGIEHLEIKFPYLGQCRHGETAATIPIVTKSNGQIEAQCKDGAFQIRWRDSAGNIKYIGRCAYEWGENLGGYCLNENDEVTRILWRNEEGHVEHGQDPSDPQNGEAHDDLINGQVPGEYEMDRYDYDVQRNRLRATKYVKHVNPVTKREEGEWRKLEILYDRAAPTSFADLRNQTGTGSGVSNGASTALSGVRTYFIGTALPGVITAHVGGSDYAVPLTGGESALEAATRVAAALNGAGIAGVLPAGNVTASVLVLSNGSTVELLVANVADEERRIEVSGQGNSGLLIQDSDRIPELTITPNAAVSILGWPARALGFRVQTSTNLIDWQPYAATNTLVASNDFLSLTLTNVLPAQYFRLAR